MNSFIVLFLVLWIVFHILGFLLSYVEWYSLKYPEHSCMPAGNENPQVLARKTLAFLFQVGFFYILYEYAKPTEILKDAGFLSNKENSKK